MKAPLIDRQRELQWLVDRLGADDDRGGRALLLLGEAGIGKTRLVMEALAGREPVLSVSFPSARLATHGYGLGRLARAAGPAGESLRAELTEEPAQLPGHWKLESICGAADDVLRALAPCIVWFDDLQWADELTLAWLMRADELLATAPVVVVACVRAATEPSRRTSSVLAPLRRAHRLEALQLEPLPPDAVRELALAIGGPGASRLADEVHRRTGGLPLAAEALLAELVRRGIPASASAAEALGAELPIPAGLVEVVREQAAELGEPARELLIVSTLVPQPAAEGLVRSLLRLSEADYDRALGSLCASGLIECDAAAAVLRFRHEVHREAVQATMPVAERRAWHRRIAARLAAEDGSPAGEIAQQLLEAGEVGEALEWLERAADEATHAHDYGNALVLLELALEQCPAERGESRAHLTERAARAAKWAGRPDAGIEIAQSSLARLSDPSHRGRVLMSLARLTSYQSASAKRIDALMAARDSFRQAGDERGQARALAALALPIGRGIELETRRALGREGLALAEHVDDPLLVGLCAGNLAAAELSAGEAVAFDLWRRANETLRDATGPEAVELRLRNELNAALAQTYGAGDEADAAMRRAAALPLDPWWSRWLAVLRAVRLWRTGRWDEAVAEAARATQGFSIHGSEIARVVSAAIAFEREPAPDVSGLVAATDALVRDWDEDWAPVAYAELLRVRLARREPRPERGLAQVAAGIVGSGMRIGWDDVLVETAYCGPATHDRFLALLGDLRPSGPRAEASIAFSQGLMAVTRSDERAEELLLDAAARFESLGEPHPAARALQAVAEARVRQGLPAGEERLRSAAIYRDLGADRSLAGLIRRAGGTRALHGMKVPSSQSRVVTAGLTPREREIATLAGRGLTARAMAEHLGISPATVQLHISRIKGKLGVRHKSELVDLLAGD